MQIAFEKDGKMAEKYRGEKNPIPYQVQDVKKLLTQLITNNEQQMEWAKQISPVMAELAHNFILEITARPASHGDTVPSRLEAIQIVMKNTKAKFPELASEANQIFTEFLQQWQQRQLRYVQKEKQVKIKPNKKRSAKLFSQKQKSKHRAQKQSNQNQENADNLNENEVQQLLAYLKKND